jgi:asparagine synthase (glutamine-hydrolysing)
VCDFDGRLSEPREYWRLRFQPEARQCEETWLEEFEELLEESVRLHLVADVPLGAFLSGGVDSTLVAATMARLLDHPVQAFSIGFDEDAYSELGHARQAARRLGVRLHTQIVRPDVVGIFEQLFARYGEPFADTSAVPTWCVSQLARRHVSTVLSGDGADEAFAGYGRYDAWMRDGWRRRFVQAWRHPRRLGRGLWQLARSVRDTPLDRWQRRYVGVCDAKLREALWRPEYAHVVMTESPAFEAAGRQAPVADRLSFAQYLDIKTYLPGDILTKVDVASMCHGLEVRTPLCDVRVMEFAARLPQSLRRDSVSAAGAQLKVLPKRSLSRTFPQPFVQRRKQGFAIPEGPWLQLGTEVRRCFEDVVMHPAARINDYLRPAQIRRLVDDFDRRGREPTALWSLLILGLWLEHHHGVLSPAVRSAGGLQGQWNSLPRDRRSAAAVA